MYCPFFFSSRRRHTRLVSDWSSDVCSSDLHSIAKRCCGGWIGQNLNLDILAVRSYSYTFADIKGVFLNPELPQPRRSEERRVGKEWRFRWWPEHVKNM